jgi:hypothetical protein
MRRAALVPVLATAIALLSACSWISATPGDHADYRETRVGKTFDERIGAAGRYLEERPDGAYAASVRKYFDKAEPVFFATRETSEKGLRDYLKALPRGPHAAEARSRLRVIEERRGRDPLLEAAATTRERLAAASESRAAAQRGLLRWLEITMDPTAYRAPLAEGPKDLVIAFSLSLPEPSCGPAEGTGAPAAAALACAKDQTFPFAIPTGKRLEDRELAFLVELALDERRVPLRATITGEQLFSRLDETFAKTERRSESIRDRIEAVGRGVDFVSQAFEKVVSPSPECAKPVTAPDVLRLECGGMRVVARAAEDETQADEIVIEPAR